MRRRGRITIKELTDEFGLSAVTIRKDLEQLEMASEGDLKRYRGGAVLNKVPIFETDFLIREEEMREEKMAIAVRAAEMVPDQGVVMLSAGTTTTYIARQLAHRKGITVVTNGINIAGELAGRSQLTVVMIGGILPEKSYATVGPTAEDYLARVTADMAFVGVAGIDAEVGFTTPYMLEAQIYAQMIQMAKKSVIVADHTKLNRRSLSIIAPLAGVDATIVDADADPQFVEILRSHGHPVIVVGSAAEGVSSDPVSRG